MKKLILLLIIGMFLFSFTSAELNNLGEFGTNECISIKQTCSSCTYVNLTVSYPNSSRVLTNAPMGDVGAGVWEYNFCNTTLEGRYDVNGEGDINGVDTSFSALYFIVSGEAGKGGIDPLAVVVFLIAFGVFSYAVTYKFNKFLGNLSFVLIGIGAFFYFIDRGVDLFGFGGLIIAIAGSVKMIFELIKF